MFRIYFLLVLLCRVGSYSPLSQARLIRFSRINQHQSLRMISNIQFSSNNKLSMNTIRKQSSSDTANQSNSNKNNSNIIKKVLKFIIQQIIDCYLFYFNIFKFIKVKFMKLRSEQNQFRKKQKTPITKFISNLLYTFTSPRLWLQLSLAFVFIYSTQRVRISHIYLDYTITYTCVTPYSAILSLFV